MTGQMKDIQNIENKYGLVPFRMGLTHLVDVGHLSGIPDKCPYQEIRVIRN